MISQRVKNILLIPMNILYGISPKTELKLLFRLKQGYSLNLKSPQTFNEKLQWMKLFWNSSIREQCSDKYTVRKYVEERCPEILPKLYWHGYSADEIPFDKLPDNYVIKVTHGSGYNIICDRNSTIENEKAKEQISKWLKQKYLPCYGEEFYGKVKPSIIISAIAESLLSFLTSLLIPILAII